MHWLDSGAQRAMVSRAASGYRLHTTGVPQGSMSGLGLFRVIKGEEWNASSAHLMVILNCCQILERQEVLKRDLDALDNDQQREIQQG